MKTPMLRAWMAVAIDTACILVFCVLGRLSHDKDMTVAGVAQTAWPFLVGASAGWLICFGWRRPLAIVPTGSVVWMGTIVVGMFIREANAQDVTLSFFVVASAVTAVLLIGWRSLAALSASRRGRRRSPPTT